MNCIDAVEGVVKDIIVNIHQASLAGPMDDTEYIRTVKTVIEGASRYILSNRELVPDPELLGKVLREFAREIWLVPERSSQAEEDSGDTSENPFDEDYYTYFFDHIYNHGVYPP